MSRRKSAVSARWRNAATGTAIVLVLSACGSTVQWSDTIAGGPLGNPAEDGLSTADPGTKAHELQRGTAADADDSLEVNPTSGAEGRISGRSATPRSGHATGGGLDAPPIAAAGRGYTAKEIFIGYGTARGLETVTNAAGVSGFGNQEAQAKAIVKDLNDRGGAAGRKIVLVFYDKKSSDHTAQAACERWTQDRPVFAVVNAVAYNELHECLAQRKTPYVDMTSHIRVQSEFSRIAPYFYAPIRPTMERLITTWMRRVKALGYFGGWNTRLGEASNAPAKIGILSYRQMRGTDFTRMVRREVERQGHAVASTFEFPNFESSADSAALAQARFQSAGVTHVIGQHGTPWYFSTAAESQRYRPRYAMSTYNGPRQTEELAPPEQMRGALGMGWVPTEDVALARDPGDVSSAQTRCRKIMQRAGEDTSAANAYNFMLRACDAFNFLTVAIAKGGLSPEGLRRGVRAMGAIPPATTFRISFANGRLDGAAAVRDLGWRDDCGGGCFAYLSRTSHGM